MKLDEYEIHFSLIVLELRKHRKEYYITIVRDPDGESKTMSIGKLLYPISSTQEHTVILQLIANDRSPHSFPVSFCLSFFISLSLFTLEWNETWKRGGGGQ